MANIKWFGFKIGNHDSMTTSGLFQNIIGGSKIRYILEYGGKNVCCND
jgi:hypothetical protein